MGSRFRGNDERGIASSGQGLGPRLGPSDNSFRVTPAQAGIQVAGAHNAAAQDWAPASAGAT